MRSVGAGGTTKGYGRAVTQIANAWIAKLSSPMAPETSCLVTTHAVPPAFGWFAVTRTSSETRLATKPPPTTLLPAEQVAVDVKAVSVSAVTLPAIRSQPLTPS